jgi:hypothetical protein
MVPDRMIGIAIVLAVPFFVLAGIIWDLFASWWAILVFGIVAGVFYAVILYVLLYKAYEKIRAELRL